METNFRTVRLMPSGAVGSNNPIPQEQNFFILSASHEDATRFLASIARQSFLI